MRVGGRSSSRLESEAARPEEIDESSSRNVTAHPHDRIGARRVLDGPSSSTGSTSVHRTASKTSWPFRRPRWTTGRVRSGTARRSPRVLERDDGQETSNSSPDALPTSARQLELPKRAQGPRERLCAFWQALAHPAVVTGQSHLDINEVILATARVPEAG